MKKEINNQKINKPIINRTNIGYDLFTKHKKQLFIMLILINAIVFLAVNLLFSFISKNSNLTSLIIVNSVLILVFLFNIFLLLLALKPLKDFLDILFPFNQANKSLSKKFSKKQYYDEFKKQVYYLKTSFLNQKIEIKDINDISRYFNNINTGILVLNPKKEIVYSNKIAKTLINKSGKLRFDYQLNNLSIEDWISNSQKTTVSNNHLWEEISALDSNNQNHWYHVAAHFQKGIESETVIIINDTTEIYSEKKNEFDFISFAAHELRGPVTVIRGYLDIIKDNQAIKNDKDLDIAINSLVVAGNRLSGYISNILNVAKFDQQHLQLTMGKNKLTTIFKEIHQDVNLRASTQNRILIFQIDSNLPDICCDKSSMSQVFINLIDNAIKYSHENGIIKIKAYCKGDYVNVEVIDKGIGMPSNVVSNLFKRFYRSHRSKDSIGGTGIGLFISKAIIESNGGYITVESIYKEGSTFTVGIPIFNNTKSDQSNKEILNNKPNNWINNHGRLG